MKDFFIEIHQKVERTKAKGKGELSPYLRRRFEKDYETYLRTSSKIPSGCKPVPATPE